MLTKLIIQNYAIIDNIQISFSEGLNVITGETGAGKSILMGALNLILGERADTSVLLDKQKKSGKIKHIGCSLNKTTQVQAEEAHNYGIEMIQVVYNRLERNAEERHLPAAVKNNLGVLARVPLASGFLTGKYKPGSTFPQNDVRSRTDQNLIKAHLEEVEKIASEEVTPGVPMAQWAMAWCLKKPEVTAVIPGCKNAEQVRMNAAAANLIP